MRQPFAVKVIHCVRDDANRIHYGLQSPLPQLSSKALWPESLVGAPTVSKYLLVKNLLVMFTLFIHM